MTVIENLEMGAFQRKDKANFKEDMDRVFTLFPRLAERKTQKAGTMSGGEQQMLAIGRALMARPKLLLLDEPSMGLAPIFVEKIFEIVKEINEQGTPILLVEQNALMALDAADRGYVLETGRIALADDAKALSGNEQVRKTYLGEVLSRSSRASATRHSSDTREEKAHDAVRQTDARNGDAALAAVVVVGVGDGRSSAAGCGHADVLQRHHVSAGGVLQRVEAGGLGHRHRHRGREASRQDGEVRQHRLRRDHRRAPGEEMRRGHLAA